MPSTLVFPPTTQAEADALVGRPVKFKIAGFTEAGTVVAASLLQLSIALEANPAQTLGVLFSAVVDIGDASDEFGTADAGGVP